ncbi:glycosyltransferase family 2 protein [Thalassomonas haliotis]|uniref:Glycosyltransferase family 2 protein n=1 Tax=Thalassomonas haliotis TaxID=485448 RepID=A0ABY7VJV0_9GAMM|nr:glycosyltransferase family 2 protein [Thalassomonas haliotis]WDE13285.1 glycosyltransferase family 2 protein [Thalassomonas haliotis]
MSNYQKKPFFSVIIPTFNRAGIIKNVLQSVLNQTEQDMEIIVVDDFSHDVEQLSEVIGRFSDNRITLVRHSKNKNGAAARNTGIEHASGQYISFLDSDDIWPKERLAKVRAEIERAGQDVENYVFYGQVEIKSMKQKSGTVKPQFGIGEMSFSEYVFVHGGLIQTSTITCRREIANQIGFDERFIRHQDYDFCLRAQAAGYQFHFVPSILSYWITSPGLSVVSKGANVDFCTFWLNEMKQHFTSAASSAYRLKVIVPIAVHSGRYKDACALFLGNYRCVPVRVVMMSLFQSGKNLVKRMLGKL